MGPLIRLGPYFQAKTLGHTSRPLASLCLPFWGLDSFFLVLDLVSLVWPAMLYLSTPCGQANPVISIRRGVSKGGKRQL
jgi:hypothetical protein